MSYVHKDQIVRAEIMIHRIKTAKTDLVLFLSDNIFYDNIIVKMMIESNIDYSFKIYTKDEFGKDYDIPIKIYTAITTRK